MAKKENKRSLQKILPKKERNFNKNYKLKGGNDKIMIESCSDFTEPPIKKN